MKKIKLITGISAITSTIAPISIMSSCNKTIEEEKTNFIWYIGTSQNKTIRYGDTTCTLLFNLKNELDDNTILTARMHDVMGTIKLGVRIKNINVYKTLITVDLEINHDTSGEQYFKLSFDCNANSTLWTFDMPGRFKVECEQY